MDCMGMGTYQRLKRGNIGNELIKEKNLLE
jgi:hypothetical protein